MQTRDHLQLGKYLLSLNTIPFSGVQKTAFLLGCIEPDYNLFSYFHGFAQSHRPLGHNAENAQRTVSRRLLRLQNSGIHTVGECYSLGILIHYLADAFTFSHRSFFPRGFSGHTEYEGLLHASFGLWLNEESTLHLMGLPQYLEFYIPRMYREYCGQEHTCKNDFSYILAVCKRTFLYLLPQTAQ